MSGREESSSAKISFLSRLSLFDGIGEHVLRELAIAARPHKWPAGHTLFMRGDPATQLIALESGRVRISLQTSGGREFVLQYVRGAAIVGELAVLDGATRTADATVATAATGYSIDRRVYADATTRHPELAQAAIRHLCRLLRYTTDHIEAIALYGLEARLARFLYAAAQQSIQPEFVLDLNQLQIADLVGSSRPKVNQALIALERKGAITRRGKTISGDLHILERLAALGVEDE